MGKAKKIYRGIQKKMRIVNSSDLQYLVENDINVRIEQLKAQMENRDEEIQNLKNKINVLEDHYKNEFEFLKNNNYRVERELFNTIKSIEYKLYELNKYTNEILYLNQLEKNKKENGEKKDFEPIVSIIIPAYNASQYLREAIDSALDQTYNKIEIIVVNDGSNDNGATKEIAESYGNKIKYLEKENGGVSSALNYGIKNMTGDYFTWLSHDDRYYKNNIEEHIKFLKSISQEKIITFTNFDIIDENSTLLVSETVVSNLYCFDYKENQARPEYSLLQGEINGGSVMIPKTAFDRCGMFDENLRISQERDMWFRLMKEYRFYNIPITTTSIRTHKNQVTNTNPDIREETDKKNLEIIEKMSKENKERLEQSEKNFYSTMKYFYKMNSLEYMQEKMNEFEKRDVE